MVYLYLTPYYYYEHNILLAAYIFQNKLYIEVTKIYILILGYLLLDVINIPF